jgi:hypothetical protein
MLFIVNDYVLRIRSYKVAQTTGPGPDCAKRLLNLDLKRQFEEAAKAAKPEGVAFH